MSDKRTNLTALIAIAGNTHLLGDAPVGWRDVIEDAYREIKRLRADKAESIALPTHTAQEKEKQ